MDPWLRELLRTLFDSWVACSGLVESDLTYPTFCGKWIVSVTLAATFVRSRRARVWECAPWLCSRRSAAVMARLKSQPDTNRAFSRQPTPCPAFGQLESTLGPKHRSSAASMKRLVRVMGKVV